MAIRGAAPHALASSTSDDDSESDDANSTKRQDGHGGCQSTRPTTHGEVAAISTDSEQPMQSRDEAGKLLPVSRDIA